MSFWRRLFGGKEEKKETKAVSLDEAVEISRKKLAETNLEAAKKICDTTRAAVKDIASKVTALSAAPSPKMDKALAAPVLESRQQVVMSLQKALDEIGFPEEVNYESLQTLYGRLGRAIVKLSSVNMKHSYYVSLGFQQHTDAIRKSAVKLGELSNGMGVELKRIALEKAPYKKLLEEKNKLDELKERAEGTKKEAGDAKEKIAEMEAKLQKTGEELSESRAGEEEAKLAELRKQKEENESRIYSQISAFSRAMRKYEKVGNFDKRTGAVLNQYLENPVRTFLSDDDFLIQKILSDIRKLLAKNELELKDNDKMIQTYDSFNFENLKTLKEETRMLDGKINEVKNRLQPLLERQEALRGEVGSTALEIKSTKIREEHLQKTLAEQEKALAEVQGSLEKMVEGFSV